MPSYEDVIEKWRELSGCVEPIESLSKSALLTYAPRLIESSFDGFGKTGKDHRRSLEELWEIKQDASAIAYALAAAFLAGHAEFNYVKGCLRNAPEPTQESTPVEQEKEEPAPVKRPKVVPKPLPARADNSIKWNEKISRFKFAPDLRLNHINELEKRRISPEFALASGVRSAADNELRELGFDLVLTTDQRNKGLQGIIFSYCDPKTREELGYRLKPDTQFEIGGGAAKYINRRGESMRAYYPHTTTLEVLQDPKADVILTEGEFKALSIADNLSRTTPKGYAVIGLAGVNGGWHREKYVVFKADGTKEERGRGTPKLIDDLESVNWKNRRVYIVFDSDVGRKKQAELFKQSKYSGALGAEFTLAQLLRARGAEVRIVEVPDEFEIEKTGADDFIARHGIESFMRLLSNNWVPNRDVDALLYVKPSCDLVIMTAQELIDSAPKKPPFVIEGLLPLGGTTIIAGPPKLGKSLVLLNLALAYAEGGKFLDLFQCGKGNVLYVQTEIPDWAMVDRLKKLKLGKLPPEIKVCSPGRLYLNFWEEEGFRRTPTGNDQIVGSLVSRMKDMGITLFMLDPLSHFHSLDENVRKHMTHFYEVIRMINRAVGCSTVISHHHRKTGGRKEQYQGAEDMLGSQSHYSEPDSVISMYRETRKDGTFRMKALFSARHCDEITPKELYKTEAETTNWSAEDWKDGDKMTLDHGRKILAELQKGPSKASDLIEKTKLPKRTFYRAASEMVEGKVIEKIGNVYYICEPENRREDTENGLPWD